MRLAGAVNPLYRSASDTMVADLVEPDRRSDAYSVMRLANNLGISIGPLVGGLLVSTSYKLGFLGAAVGMAAYGVMILLLFHETLPGLSAGAGSKPPAPRERWGGYPAILSDGTFMRFTLNFTLTTVTTVLIWTLMPVHANRNYGVPENLYAWIPFTNASMVVALQTLTTQKVKRYPVLLAMTIGSGLYALAVGGVGLAGGLGGFWVCMVVMTFGEMILAPTSSTYVANIAPVDKRGRYISLFSLYWPVASGVGPLMGGVLNDTLGPGAIWAGGFLIGALSTLAFLSFYLQQRRAVAAV
ncbi:MAG: MFS transporter, partial [Chloroflexota bacterium]